MRVDVSPRRKNAPRIAEKSAPQFLQWLRGRECLCVHAVCFGKVEAAHVDHGGDKGMGTKVSDRFAIPLCSRHHAKQHQLGWQTFQGAYEIDALKAAEQFWRAWPGRIAWERKLSDG